MEKQITILVVEDEKLLLEAIGKKLELSGVTAVLCESGALAFEYLAKSKPDVIWLDYHLRDMDGLKFMATLEEKEEWKEIPVVVVSNTATDEKINAMMVKGAKKYIVKADNKLTDIIEIVKKYAE